MARESDDGASKLGLRTKASAALSVVARSSKSARQKNFFAGGDMEFARRGRVKLRRRRREIVGQPSSGEPFDKDSFQFLHFVKGENGEDEGEESVYYGDGERNSKTIASDHFHKESENLGPMEGGNPSCPSLPETTPSDLEIEEFFSAAEKEILKRFEQTYNYDVVKDEPLEGRYEWVRINP